jgi:hypothetical protein
VSLEYLLLILRLLSAALLLAFLALIAWLIYQDLRVTAALLSDRQRHHGYLRILAAASPLLQAGARYPLRAVTTIGRAPSNTIVIDDHYASAEHALISLRGRHWWLEDLGSRNGTLLNDAPLDGAAVISAGDIITIGDAHFKIEFGE